MVETRQDKEAATFPRTIADLNERVAGIWQSIGRREFGATLASLRNIEQDLKRLA